MPSIEWLRLCQPTFAKPANHSAVFASRTAGWPTARPFAHHCPGARSLQVLPDNITLFCEPHPTQYPLSLHGLPDLLMPFLWLPDTPHRALCARQRPTQLEGLFLTAGLARHPDALSAPGPLPGRGGAAAPQPARAAAAAAGGAGAGAAGQPGFLPTAAPQQVHARVLSGVREVLGGGHRGQGHDTSCNVPTRLLPAMPPPQGSA